MVERRTKDHEDLKCGIVVVGGGGSGLAAAVAAAEKGTRTVIIEKRRNPGGDTALAGGFFAAESPALKRLRNDSNRDELIKKSMSYAHWKTDPRIVRAFINKSGDTTQWLEDMGVKFEDIAEFLPTQGCTGLTVCALLLSWKEREHKTVAAPEQSAPAASIFLPEWKVIVPGVANFLQMFVYGALTAFIPLYALRCGIANPGLFFTAMAVAMITGRIFGGKILDTYNKEKIILVLILISMIAMVILSFSKTLPLFIFVGLFWGVGAAFFMPACMAYALEFAGSPSGAAVGTFQALVDLGMALGPVIMGLIIPITGYPTMFLCLAFIYLIDMCYFQFYVRKRRRMVVSA